MNINISDDMRDKLRSIAERTAVNQVWYNRLAIINATITESSSKLVTSTDDYDIKYYAERLKIALNDLSLAKGEAVSKLVDADVNAVLAALPVKEKK